MRRLLVSFVSLFVVVFTFTPIAQEFGLLKKRSVISFPEKIQKAVLEPLPSGTYTIGSGGDFPTIDSAFNKLSVDGIAGEVILELTDNLYTTPTDFFGVSLNGPIIGVGPNSRVTIKPANNKNVTIQGSGWCVLSFFNTSFLTLDGIDLTGLTTLTIKALYNNQFDSNNTMLFLNNSDHNIVRNITLVSEDHTRISAAIAFSPFVNFSTPFVTDSNLIQHNLIKQGGVAILVQGSDIQKAIGNQIVDNIIGDESESLITWGITLDNNENTLVENNIVRNIEHISYFDFYHDGIHGIRASHCNETVIRNNVIHNINDPNLGYYNTHHGAAGIIISGLGNEFGNNNLIYNNMIYDIRHGQDQSVSCAAGINIWYQNNPEIYYNSVYLDDTGSSPSRSAALNIDDACTNVEVKNNIFVNTRKEYNYSASAIYDYTDSNLTSDHNDLYYDAYQNNCLVKIHLIGTTNEYHTLAEWQTTGKDLNSITEMPSFIAPDNLRINNLIATNIESHGTPIIGIETDFDGELRNHDSTDIGADEFDGIILGIDEEKYMPIEFSVAQNFPNPFNPVTTIKYQIPYRGNVSLKIYDIIGNEITELVNEEQEVGYYNTEFNASKFSSGVYFYRLQAGEFISTKKMLLLK